MAWSYSFNPSDSPKDNVRFLLGDTNKKEPLLHDEEILYLLSQANGRVYSAAVNGCEAIMSRLSGAVDETVGSVSIKYSQRLQGFEKLLVTLRRRQAIGGGIRLYSGSIDRPAVFSVTSGINPERCGWFIPQRTFAGPPSACKPGQPYGVPAPPSPPEKDTGARIITGTTDPTDDTPGVPGVYYMNITTHTVFGPYTIGDDGCGFYPTPDSGELGCGGCGCCDACKRRRRRPDASAIKGGDRFLTGTTDPTADTPGEPGDYYVNLTTNRLFGPFPGTAPSIGAKRP